MGNELLPTGVTVLLLWLRLFKLMESSSNYEKCLTSKLVRYDDDDGDEGEADEEIVQKNLNNETWSLLHISSEGTFHTSSIVIRLISCCIIFLHFHARYHLQPHKKLCSDISFLSFAITKKGKKSKKIIGLIILYACHEYFHSHI